jgi:hypothetical protein
MSEKELLCLKVPRMVGYLSHKSISIRGWILNIGVRILTGENRRTDGKACHIGILSTTNLTWTGPVPRYCPGGKTVTTNCLILGRIK